MPTNCLQLKKDYEDITKLKQEFDMEYKIGRYKEGDLKTAYEWYQKNKAKILEKFDDIRWLLPKLKKIELFNWAKKELGYNERRTNIFIDDFKIISDKKEILIKHSLEFEGSLIRSLPNNLTIKGALTINCANMKFLPSNLKVESLYIQYSQIEFLPKDLIIEKHLWIIGTPVKSLPDNLKIGFLQLQEVDITSLPSNLQIMADFIIIDTNIKFLPDDLYVQGNIFVDINLKKEAERLNKLGGIKGDVSLNK